MIHELNASLRPAIREWARARALADGPCLVWEGSHGDVDRASELLCALVGGTHAAFFEVPEGGRVDVVRLIESGSIDDAIRAAFSGHQELRVWSVRSGHSLQIDPTGWAEDPHEVTVAGSGDFEPLVNALHEQLGAGAVRRQQVSAR